MYSIAEDWALHPNVLGLDLHLPGMIASSRSRGNVCRVSTVMSDIFAPVLGFSSKMVRVSPPSSFIPSMRQGGALNADLYKVYVNPLLDILSNSGLGGKIGNINCCADDVALIANNPFDIQTMVDIAVDFSKREGYLLQPQKKCGNTDKHM